MVGVVVPAGIALRFQREGRARSIELQDGGRGAVSTQVIATGGDIEFDLIEFRRGRRRRRATRRGQRESWSIVGQPRQRIAAAVNQALRRLAGIENRDVDALNVPIVVRLAKGIMRGQADQDVLELRDGLRRTQRKNQVVRRIVVPTGLILSLERDDLDGGTVRRLDDGVGGAIAAQVVASGDDDEFNLANVGPATTICGQFGIAKASVGILPVSRTKGSPPRLSWQNT